MWWKSTYNHTLIKLYKNRTRQKVWFYLYKPHTHHSNPDVTMTTLVKIFRIPEVISKLACPKNSSCIYQMTWNVLHEERRWCSAKFYAHVGMFSNGFLHRKFLGFFPYPWGDKHVQNIVGFLWYINNARRLCAIQSCIWCITWHQLMISRFSRSRPALHLYTMGKKRQNKRSSLRSHHIFWVPR